MFLFTPLRVIDGDTIVGNLDRGHNIFSHDHKIRLLGVNTPELHAKDPIEKAAAEKAKQFMIDNLKMGEPYIFESKEVDAFGRSLGMLYTDATCTASFNQKLLDNNLAKPFKG